MPHLSKISDSDSDDNIPLAQAYAKKNNEASQMQQPNLPENELSGLSDDSTKDPNFKLEKGDLDSSDSEFELNVRTLKSKIKRKDRISSEVPSWKKKPKNLGLRSSSLQILYSENT